MGLLIETQTIIPGKNITFTINANGNYYFSLNNNNKNIAQVAVSQIYPYNMNINPGQTFNTISSNYTSGTTITFNSNLPVTAALYLTPPNYNAEPFFIDLEYPELVENTSTNTNANGNNQNTNNNNFNLSLILTSLENLNNQISNINNTLSDLANVVTLNSQGLIALSAEFNQLYTNQEIISGNVDLLYNSQSPLVSSISS